MTPEQVLSIWNKLYANSPMVDKAFGEWFAYAKGFKAKDFTTPFARAHLKFERVGDIEKLIFRNRAVSLDQRSATTIRGDWDTETIWMVGFRVDRRFYIMYNAKEDDNIISRGYAYYDIDDDGDQSIRTAQSPYRTSLSSAKSPLEFGEDDLFVKAMLVL